MVVHRMHDIGVKVADSAAAGTIATATWINLADVHLIIQIIAGCVAIVAGLSAAAYHIYKTRQLYLQGKQEAQKEAQKDE